MSAPTNLIIVNNQLVKNKSLFDNDLGRIGRMARFPFRQRFLVPRKRFPIQIIDAGRAAAVAATAVVGLVGRHGFRAGCHVSAHSRDDPGNAGGIPQAVHRHRPDDCRA